MIIPSEESLGISAVWISRSGLVVMSEGFLRNGRDGLHAGLRQRARVCFHWMKRALSNNNRTRPLYWRTTAHGRAHPPNTESQSSKSHGINAGLALDGVEV